MNESRNRPIRKFNPGTLQSDEEVIEQFVVREHELDIVLDVLRGNVESSSCQHVLVVAPRGRGKTMLLARVAAELRADDELPGRLLPVRFMEESQEIFHLGDFWLETLFHLARESAEHDPEVARGLRESHAALTGRWREQTLEEHARAAVLEAADRLGKKLVLMVENFQGLCENVDDDFGWKLRGALQSDPQIMLLATATSRFEGLDDAREPFFELFRIVGLQPLTTDECRRLWQVVSGDEVREREIRPLEILTGGNPRLLVIVAGFAQHRSLRQLMEELVKLIDEHTEYFRNNLEVLGKTERRVYIAVIDLWRASNTGEIAARARMDVRTVSTMLGRLVNRGLVIGKGSGKKRYAAEGLYSIYYKLRRERDEAAVVASLINFMVTFYRVGELFQMSGLLTSEAAESTVIREGIKRALAERSRDVDVFSNMEWRAIQKISDQAAASHHFAVEPQLQEEINAALNERTFEKVVEIVNKAVGSQPASMSEVAESREVWLLHRKAIAFHELKNYQAAILAYEEVIARFCASNVAALQIEAARALINKGVAQGQLGDFVAGVAACEQAIERFGESDVPELQVVVARAWINKGEALGQLGDLAAAIAACEEAIERFGGSNTLDLQVAVARALFNKGAAQGQRGDLAAAIAVCDEVIARFGGSDVPGLQVEAAKALVNKGVAQGQRGDLAAAIAVCDEVIARFGGSDVPDLQVAVARALLNKGVAQGQRGDLAASIAAYDEMVERFGEREAPDLQLAVAKALVNKGVARRRLGDLGAAIAAYDEVVERFGERKAPDLQVAVARALVDKGFARRQLGDMAASIAACDEVIARFGESDVPDLQVEAARALFSKGVSQGKRGDMAAAIAAYDEVVERFGDREAPELEILVGRALGNKGATQGQLGNLAAAIAAWDGVVQRFGEREAPELHALVARALVDQGVVRGQLGDLAAAIAAHEEVIARFGESDVPELQVEAARAFFNKGVAQGHLGDLAAAIAAWDRVEERYAKSKAPKFQVLVAKALGNKGIAQRKLGDFTAAMATCEEVIERFGASEAPELQVQVSKALGNKGIARRMRGDLVAAIAAYDEVIERFGESGVPALQVEVATALSYKGIEQTEIGRAEEALHTCEELERKLGTLTGSEASKLAWSATQVRIRALLIQGKYQAAMDRFRSAYAEFDLRNETMIQMMIDAMLRLVPDLIASGVPDHDLLEILSSDKAKSDALEPLLVTLRQRIGEKVRAPAEVLEVAADIHKRIETKPRR